MNTPSLRASRFAAPLKGAHPAAWQSQFRGCSRMARSAAAWSACRRVAAGARDAGMHGRPITQR
jgi:hypothetical protein